MQATVYSREGKKVGTIKLPEHVFDVPWNADLVHQVVVSMQANARNPIAHTKDRSEVRGGGRKPWKQKGTGRARHGSRRSPIWVGGGVTFGPRNDKSYDKKINRKMRASALRSVLSRKLKDGEIIFVDSLSFSAPKTKEAREILSSLAHIPEFASLKRKKKNAALIALSKNDLTTKRSFRNIGNVAVEEVRNLNPVDVLSYKYVVVAEPEKAMEFLATKGKADTVKAKTKAETKEKVATSARKKTVVKKAAVKKVARKAVSKK